METPTYICMCVCVHPSTHPAIHTPSQTFIQLATQYLLSSIYLPIIYLSPYRIARKEIQLKAIHSVSLLYLICWSSLPSSLTRLSFLRDLSPFWTCLCGVVTVSHKNSMKHLLFPSLLLPILTIHVASVLFCYSQSSSPDEIQSLLWQHPRDMKNLKAQGSTGRFKFTETTIVSPIRNRTQRHKDRKHKVARRHQT